MAEAEAHWGDGWGWKGVLVFGGVGGPTFIGHDVVCEGGGVGDGSPGCCCHGAFRRIREWCLLSSCCGTPSGPKLFVGIPKSTAMGSRERSSFFDADLAVMTLVVRTPSWPRHTCFTVDSGCKAFPVGHQEGFRSHFGANRVQHKHNDTVGLPNG